MSQINLSILNADYFTLVKPLDCDIDLVCDKETRSKVYALKKYNLENFDETDFALLDNEIRLCKQLKHQNLLPYLSSFVHLDQLWIVTPLCLYSSADKLSKPYGLPEIAIAHIIQDVLLALIYLHQRGIIHRSIKASHLLINVRGRCMLTGLKYSINQVLEGRMQTYVHQYPMKAKSNINWFAPEILEQNLFGYTHKSDIYSLGLTCCELANGIIPFSDLQPTEMLLDKLTGYAPRLLDKTCRELENINTDEMNESERQRYYAFESKQFSSAFHQFTSNLCLNFDPQKRPDAEKLLHHSFIKQLKRYLSSSLLNFVDPHIALYQKEDLDKLLTKSVKEEPLTTSLMKKTS